MSGALCSVGILVLTWCGCHSSGECASNEVKVSSFGYDPVDSTRFIQAALDSGASRVILDRQDGPWPSLTLKIRSNTEFVLDPGVELQAKRGAFRGVRDFFVVVHGVTNVTLRGGEGSAIRMWKCDYQKPPYEKSEWRYALRIMRSANVLVEGLRICDSGGDGVGIGGCSRDVTIRKCVFDNNHRQGASVFSVENLLVEDTVFSNTKGTPPAAGIDFEPDCNKWNFSNCIFRNCVFENNAGSGIEFYFEHLYADTKPISLTFENCRIENNAAGVKVMAGRRGHDLVKGDVRFVNCLVSRSRGTGVLLQNITDDSFDVGFSGCSIDGSGGKDVAFVIGCRELGGVIDGVDLGDLSVRREKDADWLSYEGGFCAKGICKHSKNVSGTVRLTVADREPSVVRTDAEWFQNLARNPGCANLPSMEPLPEACRVEVIDGQPGEVVSLAPAAAVGCNYLFFSETNCLVKFVGRQVVALKGRKPAKGRKLLVESMPDGKVVAETAFPLDVSTGFAVNVPRLGFYRLRLPSYTGTRFLLEKASVPVACDVSEGPVTVAAMNGEPFSLWTWSEGDAGMVSYIGGTDYYHFKMSVLDPSGERRYAFPCVEEVCPISLGHDKPGLWRHDFSKSEKGTYAWINLFLFSPSRGYFLSPVKYWRPLR